MSSLPDHLSALPTPLHVLWAIRHLSMPALSEVLGRHIDWEIFYGHEEYGLLGDLFIQEDQDHHFSEHLSRLKRKDFYEQAFRTLVKAGYNPMLDAHLNGDLFEYHSLELRQAAQWAVEEKVTHPMGYSWLDLCCLHTHDEEVVKIFFEISGTTPSLDQDGNTSLHLLWKSLLPSRNFYGPETLKVTQFLMDAGVDIFHRNNHGENLLICIQEVLDVAEYDGDPQDVEGFVASLQALYDREALIDDLNEAKGQNNKPSPGRRF